VSDELPIRKYASAGGIVIDTSGQRVLTLVRPKRLGPDGLPEVRLPKGHIEPSESRQQAALREVEEEAGLSDLDIVADLGHQVVEFEYQGHHYVRDESYFLMTLGPYAAPGCPEKQFATMWVTWEEAQARMTFEAEREWLRRGQSAAEALPALEDPRYPT
jgi:8-oxo-dGTP pyrophosphatase MutT (NUDIX family)